MPNNVERTILRKIRELAVEPLAPNNNVAALRGAVGRFRLRVGEWRVLYTLDPAATTMTIVHILPRGEAYR